MDINLDYHCKRYCTYSESNAIMSSNIEDWFVNLDETDTREDGTKNESI